MFRWVGPITTTNWVLYGKNNNPHKLKNIQDARAFRIGSYKNSATGLELTAQGYKVELAASDEENPNLIMMNRIDYWIVAEQRGKYIAEQKGYGKDISPVITYKTIDLYMLCHPGMDNARIEKYNQLSKDIDKDGTMEKILRKYGVR
jgi:polar amino acid transport system substrate-binding protein